jgi:hypothetical protein
LWLLPSPPPHLLLAPLQALCEHKRRPPISWLAEGMRVKLTRQYNSFSASRSLLLVYELLLLLLLLVLLLLLLLLL